MDTELLEQVVDSYVLMISKAHTLEEMGMPVEVMSWVRNRFAQNSEIPVTLARAYSGLCTSFLAGLTAGIIYHHERGLPDWAKQFLPKEESL